jgi:hypothetical protein
MITIKTLVIILHELAEEPHHLIPKKLWSLPEGTAFRAYVRRASF